MILNGLISKVCFLFKFLVIFFFKYVSNISQRMCFCYNTFINHYANDGLNKGVLKITKISIENENNDQTFIIPLYSSKLLTHFDEIVFDIMAKSESKKKSVYNLVKDNNNERQNNDEVIKK